MKSIFKSKTFWFGLLQITGSIAGLVAAVFPPSAAIAGAVAGVTTIILRTVTNTAVSIPVINPNPTVAALVIPQSPLAGTSVLGGMK